MSDIETLSDRTFSLAVEFSSMRTRNAARRQIEAQLPPGAQIEVLDAGDRYWWLDISRLTPLLVDVHERLQNTAVFDLASVCHEPEADELRRVVATARNNPGRVDGSANVDDTIVVVRGPAILLNGVDPSLWPGDRRVAGLTTVKATSGDPWFGCFEATMAALERDIHEVASGIPELERFEAGVTDSNAPSADPGPFAWPRDSVLGFTFDPKPLGDEQLVVWVPRSDLAAFAKRARHWHAYLTAYAGQLDLDLRTQVWRPLGQTDAQLSEGRGVPAWDVEFDFNWIARSEVDSPVQSDAGTWVDTASLADSCLAFGISSGVRSADAVLRELAEAGVRPARAEIVPDAHLRWAYIAPAGTAFEHRRGGRRSWDESKIWVRLSCDSLADLRQAIYLVVASAGDKYATRSGLVDDESELVFLHLSGATLTVLHQTRRRLRRYNFDDLFFSPETMPNRKLIARKRKAEAFGAKSPALIAVPPDQSPMAWSWFGLITQEALDELARANMDGALRITRIATATEVLALSSKGVAALVRELRMTSDGSGDSDWLVAELEVRLDKRWTSWRSWTGPFTILGFGSHAMKT